MRVGCVAGTVKALVWIAAPGWAHVSEQGFVLLLPTGIYTSAGVAAVVATVVLLLLRPGAPVESAGSRLRREYFGKDESGVAWSSGGAALVLAGLLWIGWTGPRDPLSNLLPLVFWIGWWVALVSLAGLLGNPWRWLNPWSWSVNPVGRRLPAWIGVWLAVAGLIGFAAFLLADVAPDDPARLARLIALYVIVTFGGVALYGQAWLDRAEAATVLFRLLGDLAPVRWRSSQIGWPGWRLPTQAVPLSLGIFSLAFLGIGSFDGINETFWWLGRIGVNPLEFPGRSAVIWPTLAGLAGAIAALIAAFALCIWIGARLVDIPFRPAFATLALSVLPIAFGYHIAHYLTAFLVNIQYTVAALSDPWATGADWLGIEPYYVTTGFFNRIDTVRVIWLTQAGAVVIGHIWAVVLAHRMAAVLAPGGRRAALLTAPLSAFMVAYTFLGLWLLAAPRGA